MSALSPDLSFYLTQMLWSAPYLLLYVVLGILALVFRSRAPGASMFALFGFSTLFIATFTSALLNAVIMQQAHAANMSSQQISTMFAILGIGRAVLYICGMVLIFIAVFSGRGRGNYVRQPGEPPAHGL